MAIPTPEPRIARFERMGYGMFIHWGLYAHLGQGEWVQHLRKVPMDEYARIKDTFTAEEFDGRQIAAIAKAAGMQYITLTSRHHDGFSLYDTRGLCDHDAPHSAAGRDLVAELIEGCRAEGISPHFYTRRSIGTSPASTTTSTPISTTYTNLSRCSAPAMARSGACGLTAIGASPTPTGRKTASTALFASTSPRR